MFRACKAYVSSGIKNATDNKNHAIRRRENCTGPVASAQKTEFLNVRRLKIAGDPSLLKILMWRSNFLDLYPFQTEIVSFVNDAFQHADLPAVPEGVFNVPVQGFEFCAGHRACYGRRV